MLKNTSATELDDPKYRQKPLSNAICIIKTDSTSSVTMWLKLLEMHQDPDNRRVGESQQFPSFFS